MITLSKIGKVSNLKERELRFPEDNQFTQPNAIQIKVNELRSLQEIAEQSSSQIINYTMQQEFSNQQSQNNPDNGCINTQMDVNQKDVNLVGDSSSILIYEENEIIGIPEIVHSLTQDNDEWYIYGNKNPDSFFKSVLLMHSSDYILKSNSDKNNYVSTFKREIAIKMESIYKRQNYRDLRFKKNDMTDDLINKSVINYPLTLLTVDYIKQNFCIIDIKSKKYSYYESPESSETDKFFVILKDNKTYLPMMNSQTGNKFHISKLQDIIDRFEEESVPNPFKKRVFIKNNGTSSNRSLSLKSSEKSYSLAELKQLALDNGLSVVKSNNYGKDINKTRKELFDELSKLS